MKPIIFHSSEINFEPVPITEPYPEKEAREKVIHSFVDSILDPINKAACSTAGCI